MLSKNLQVHSALLLVNLIYAAGYSVTKITMPTFIKPSGFIILRVIGALICLFLYQKIFIKEKITDIKDIAFLALCAVCGVATNMLMFFNGLAITSPINASLIMVTTPILVLCIGFIARTEVITWLKIAGIFGGTIVNG